jgi:hypothetical protein
MPVRQLGSVFAVVFQGHFGARKDKELIVNIPNRRFTSFLPDSSPRGQVGGKPPEKHAGNYSEIIIRRKPAVGGTS